MSIWGLSAFERVCLRIARFAAERSKDHSTKVGAFVDVDGDVKYRKCNEFPERVQDLPERRERPAKYLWTGHAEEHIIAQAARTQLEGKTMYMTHFCCATCARLIIGAGIRKVVVGGGKTHMPDEQFIAAETMLLEAGVEIVRV